MVKEIKEKGLGTEKKDKKKRQQLPAVAVVAGPSGITFGTGNAVRSKEEKNKKMDRKIQNSQRPNQNVATFQSTNQKSNDSAFLMYKQNLKRINTQALEFLLRGSHCLSFKRSVENGTFDTVTKVIVDAAIAAVFFGADESMQDFMKPILLSN